MGMGNLKIEEHNEGSVFVAKIVPGRSGATRICGLLDEMLKVKVSAAPEKGKANQCLIKFLSKQLGVKKNAVSIISGTTSPVKHVKVSGMTADTLLKKCIFAVDELTGLIVAVALVRPSKKLADVGVQSIMKKWKEKSFASGVDRKMIAQGAEELGVTLTEHIEIVLKAMQDISEKLGL